MTKKAYLWLVFGVCVLSFSGLLFIVFQLDPERAGALGIAVGYLILILFLTSFFNLFIFWLRSGKAGGAQSQIELLGISLRQAMIISLAVAIGLLLQQFRILVWWTGLFVLAGAFLIELYFLTKKQ